MSSLQRVREPSSIELIHSTTDTIKKRRRRKSVRQLRDEVRSEIQITLRVVRAPSPSKPIPYRQGPIITSYRLDPSRLNDENLNDAFVAEFCNDIRQWSIPGMSFCITDLGGALVINREGDEFPIAVDIFEIKSRKELIRLRDGLRSMRM